MSFVGNLGVAGAKPGNVQLAAGADTRPRMLWRGPFNPTDTAEPGDVPDRTLVRFDKTNPGQVVTWLEYYRLKAADPNWWVLQ